MKIGFDGRYSEGDLVGVGKYIQNLVSGVLKKGNTCIIFYSKKPKNKITGSVGVILNSKNRVEHDLEIMTRRRIAVQVQTTGWFQDAMQFHKSRRHHHQIRHHLVRANELTQRANHRGYALGRILHQIFVRMLRAFAPVPRVVKCFNLRVRFRAALVLEQHVVRTIRVERRIEIDQVNAFIRDMLAQDGQIVAVEKCVGCNRFGHRHFLTFYF